MSVAILITIQKLPSLYHIVSRVFSVAVVPRNLCITFKRMLSEIREVYFDKLNTWLNTLFLSTLLANLLQNFDLRSIMILVVVSVVHKYNIMIMYSFL